MLTGLHPWSHRAFQLGAGGIAQPHVDHNVFAALSDTRNTLGFAHNRFADLLLSQMGKYLDTHIPNSSFNVEHSLFYGLPFFKRDVRTAYSSLEENIFQLVNEDDSSLFLGSLYQLWVLRNRVKETDQNIGEYPRGLPDSGELFRLEDLGTGAIKILSGLN